MTGVPAAQVLAGLQNPDLNENTRISWKFACSRSVTGTPSFFVNDLPLFDQGDGFSLAQWTRLLDPLFTAADDEEQQPCRKQLTGFVAPHTAVDRSRACLLDA